MIRTHYHQASLWTGILAEEVNDLWEPWMRSADRLLDDEKFNYENDSFKNYTRS